MNQVHERLRQLPGVDELVRRFVQQQPPNALPRPLIVDAARAVLDEVRHAVRTDTGAVDPSLDSCMSLLAQRVAAIERRLFTPVINATGVILHTNLGRAPLSRRALEAVVELSTGYSNLEYRIDEGRRGSRHDHGEALLTRLTGAEAAMVVNNNAAAVLLALAAVAAGGEVIVSRGELIEIGGGFRIPEVLQQSGSRLREVGTTNRTRLTDYAQAIGEETRALLKVHTSNYRIRGFTESVPSADLVRLGRSHQLPVIEDLGSGVLLDTAAYGLAHEPTVLEAVEAGVDLVTLSGDKLLGGPQAGIILGRAEWVERCRTHPLARAVRVDKMTLAALQATLSAYLDGEAEREIPIWQMMAATKDQLRQRGEVVAAAIESACPHMRAWLEDGVSAIGGGALPEETRPTILVTLQTEGMSADRLAARLRQGRPPVIGRIENGLLRLDLRTVDPNADAALIASLTDALQGAE